MWRQLQRDFGRSTDQTNPSFSNPAASELQHLQAAAETDSRILELRRRLSERNEALVVTTPQSTGALLGRFEHALAIDRQGFFVLVITLKSDHGVQWSETSRREITPDDLTAFKVTAAELIERALQ